MFMYFLFVSCVFLFSECVGKYWVRKDMAG